MVFTNNCLILKNTKELKNKLIQIGRVEERNEGNSEYYDCLLCYEDKFIELDAYDVIDLIGLDENEYTHCVTNAELFLAIAALRDDSDINQYFVLDTTVCWASENCKPKGTFILCKKDKWNVDFDINGNPSVFSSRNIPAHKATVEELIEHFK